MTTPSTNHSLSENFKDKLFVLVAKLGALSEYKAWLYNKVMSTLCGIESVSLIAFVCQTKFWDFAVTYLDTTHTADYETKVIYSKQQFL